MVRGEIYFVDLEPRSGAEQNAVNEARGWRSITHQITTIDRDKIIGKRIGMLSAELCSKYSALVKGE